MEVSAGTLLTVAIVAVLAHPGIAASGAVTAAGAVVLAIVIGLSVLGSVLLHELAHALLARAFGAQVDHIALTLWGGHTSYVARGMSHSRSALVSLAGPAANLVIALVAWAVGGTPALPPWADVLCDAIVLLNLGLALFNLLPGLPMDGGRAVESGLAAFLRRPVTGTVITGWIGRAIAVIVLALPLWGAIWDPEGTDLVIVLWSALIAMTLWQGAGAALLRARGAERLAEVDLSALLRPVTLLDKSTPVAALDDRTSAELETLIIATDGALAHRIDPRALAAVSAEHRSAIAVAAVTVPVGPILVIPHGTDAATTAQLLAARPHGVHLMLDAQGDIAGRLVPGDLAARLDGR